MHGEGLSPLRTFWPIETFMANVELGPPHGLGKELVTDAILQPTNQAHAREGRGNNFFQLHILWLTLFGLSTVMGGLNVPGCKLLPNPHAEEKIPPNASFMASSGIDLRFVLNGHPPARILSGQFGSAATSCAPRRISGQSHTS